MGISRNFQTPIEQIEATNEIERLRGELWQAAELLLDLRDCPRIATHPFTMNILINKTLRNAFPKNWNGNG